MVSSPKNENYVINYSPWCRSKPIRILFIFGTQIKIFLFESESSLTLLRQQGSLHDQSPEKYQDDQQSGPCDISLSTVILWSHENTLCAKKTKITILFHIFVSTVSLVDVCERTSTRETVEKKMWNKIVILFFFCRSSWYFSGLWSCKDPCCLWEGQRALRFKLKYINLCSEDEQSN